MNVLVIGSGAREHALAWKIKQSPRVQEIFIAAGNAGTATVGKNVPLDYRDHEAVIHFCYDTKVDLVVVGPDDALATGIVDSLGAAGIKVFGPTKAAAEIEWSKSLAKELMREAGIPTAASGEFSDFELVKKYLYEQKFPLVIKADGLALGKGVVIAKTKGEALRALHSMLVTKSFGAAGEKVLIEEYLEGDEISIHAFCDGETAVLFPLAQDHKRVFDGDRGPNTGGMGTIVPVPWVSPELLKEIKEEIVLPILRVLKDRGRTFKGILYPGIMVTKDGPKVLEFNARFGDPEAESYMRLLKTDVVDILMASVEGRLGEVPIEWEGGAACCLMAASGGYPGRYETGFEITGLDAAEADPDVIVFHAGTALKDGKIVTTGGRVLGVTAVGERLEVALAKAYAALAKIHFDGMHDRKDIGRRSVKHP